METPPPVPGAKIKTSRLAISSLVLGILSLVLLVLCVGILFAIPAVICGHVAYSRIKRSAGALEGQGMAFAGLIMGYVAIGLMIILIPLAIPNFVKARDTAQKNQCINNLRMIDGAKQEWALKNNKTSEDTPTEQDLNKYLLSKGHSFESLHCPKGGTYTIGKVGEAPACSEPGHQLP